MSEQGTITIENARLVFRNFQGKEGPFNQAGSRNFCVLLDEKLAKQLDKDGWNVKALRAREEGDPEQPYMQVMIKYGKGRPPNVVQITSRGRTNLGEDEIEILDWADITNVDMIIRPYSWDIGGKTGVKAYLKSMFVTIQEDELDLKYANVPTSGHSGHSDE